MNKLISIHHVGGRGGGGFFPVPSRFQRDLVMTFYEADVDCIEQIKERNRYLKSQVRVLPYCLGPGSGQATLFINYDPYTSSLLQPNPFYRNYRLFSNYGFGKDYDYVLGQAMRPMETRVLSTVGLDELFCKGLLDSTLPDFLSLDTEGFEYEILTGARQVLQRSTLAVALEVEFHPMFTGQKLFGDVSNLLASQGFLFVGFSRAAPTWTPNQSPIGLRGGGIQLGDDALFIRRVETISTDQDELHRCLMLSKLAFLALTFNQVEIACECLRLVETSEAASVVRNDLAPMEYGRFLTEFWTAAKRQPAFFPATFESQFTFEASRSRCATAGKRGARWIELIRDWCVRKPQRWRLLKRLGRPLFSGLRRLTLFIKLVTAGKAFWRHPALQWRTEVERVLIRFGLCEQEKTLRRNRWLYSPSCKERIPLRQSDGQHEAP